MCDVYHPGLHEAALPTLTSYLRVACNLTMRYFSQEATGIYDINEIVNKFLEAEEQNFSLFNYGMSVSCCCALQLVLKCDAQSAVWGETCLPYWHYAGVRSCTCRRASLCQSSVTMWWCRKRSLI
jgi:hypothetical protein